MKNISQIVDTLKKEFGFVSDEELAGALEMSKTALSNRKSRGSIPYEELSTFCEKKGISLDWLLTGQGHMRREEPVSVPPHKFPAEDFVFIPVKRGPIGAGRGLLPDETIEIRIAFRKDWIQRKGKPENMSLIRVQGDSMEPTLYSGDLVLVDHNRDYIDRSGGIYAICLRSTAEGEIMVKRVYPSLSTGRLRIISDNKARYPEEEAGADEVMVNGKVIWFAREIER